MNNVKTKTDCLDDLWFFDEVADTNKIYCVTNFKDLFTLLNRIANRFTFFNHSADPSCLTFIATTTLNAIDWNKDGGIYGGVYGDEICFDIADISKLAKFDRYYNDKGKPTNIGSHSFDSSYRIFSKNFKEAQITADSVENPYYTVTIMYDNETELTFNAALR